MNKSLKTILEAAGDRTGGDRALLAAFADHLGALCVASMLEWGKAVRDAEAAKGTPAFEEKAKTARLAGAETQRMAFALSERIHTR